MGLFVELHTYYEEVKLGVFCTGMYNSIKEDAYICIYYQIVVFMYVHTIYLQ